MGMEVGHSSFLPSESTFAAFPYDIVLARLPFVHYPKLRCVCRSWNEALSPSGSVVMLRHSLGLAEEWPIVQIYRPNKPFRWYAINPRGLSCHRIPSPSSIHIEQAAGRELCRLFLHRFDLCGQLHLHTFDASLMQWQHAEVPAMQWRRNSRASAVVEDYWYVAGGTWHYPRSVERMRIGNPSMLSSWERIPDMHLGRMHARALARRGCLYVLGGETAIHGRAIYSGEVWDPMTGEWTLVPELWPVEVFKDCTYEQAAVVVVMGALFVLVKSSGELMCYNDDKKEWVCLGRVPVVESEHTFCKLLAVGSHLWLIFTEAKPELDNSEVSFLVCILDTTSVTLAMLSAPPTGNPSWKAFRIGFDGTMDSLQDSVAFM